MKLNNSFYWRNHSYVKRTEFCVHSRCFIEAHGVHHVFQIVWVYSKQRNAPFEIIEARACRYQLNNASGKCATALTVFAHQFAALVERQGEPVVFWVATLRHWVETPCVLAGGWQLRVQACSLHFFRNVCCIFAEFSNRYIAVGDEHASSLHRCLKRA
jgi:hypothetical protein